MRKMIGLIAFGVLLMAAQVANAGNCDDEARLADVKLQAENGDGLYEYLLGECYFDGRGGVAQNYQEAFTWFSKDAKKGDWLGMVKLGEMYRDGKGVSKDYVRSHMWFNLASISQTQFANATGERDRIAFEMTPAQINQAQSLALICRQSHYQDCGD